MLMVSTVWTQMVAELNVVKSTGWSFGASVVFTLIIVLIFTQNILLAAYTTVTILLTVITLLGFLIWVLQWKFGPIQAVGIIFFVGLSVDYCLHIAHGYNVAKWQSSGDKVKQALQHLGTAVLGGAITTIGCVVFLWFCYIKLFVELGVMIFANMLLAIIYTFFFLVPVLIIAGPTGHCGSLWYLYYLVSGKKEEVQDLKLDEPDAVTYGAPAPKALPKAPQEAAPDFERNPVLNNDVSNAKDEDKNSEGSSCLSVPLVVPDQAPGPATLPTAPPGLPTSKVGI
jgi:hypothetical protein